MKPRVLRSCEANPNRSWFVYMESKKPSFFEHWWVAVAFAIYIARNPHVMHDREWSIDEMRAAMARAMGGAAYISEGWVYDEGLEKKRGWYVLGWNDTICLVWGHKTEREAILAGLEKVKTHLSRETIKYPVGQIC